MADPLNSTVELTRQQLIIAGVLTNLVLGGLLVWIVNWQYSYSKTRAAAAGIIYGSLVVFIEQFISVWYIEAASWTAIREGIIASAIGAVIGMSLFGAYLLDTQLSINLVLPRRGPSDEDDSNATADDTQRQSRSDDTRTARADSDHATETESPDTDERSVVGRAIHRTKVTLGLAEPDQDKRIPMSDLSGDEVQEAIDFLEATNSEPHKAAIEEAAYHLRTTDQETQLASAFETTDERSRIDQADIAPTEVKEEGKWHTRDSDFYQILTATSLPRFVSPGWLIPLTLSGDDVRLSMHIQPRETSNVKSRLQQRLTQMKSAIRWKKRRQRTDTHEEEYEAEELERLLKQLVQGATKMFDVALYAEVRGNSLEAMQDASDRIRRQGRQQGLDLEPLEGQQDESQASLAPLATDPIDNDNTVQLEALSHCFNMVEPAIDDEGGVLFGFDNTNRPVIVDRYALSGHSKAVTGKVGSGKSYAVKMALWRRLLVDDNLRTIVFDPLGDDFVDFARSIGGGVIKFGGDYRINPLDIDPAVADTSTDENPFKLKLRNVLRLFRTYLGSGDPMGADEEGVLTNAIYYAYLSRGITPSPSTFGNESPIIDDVIEGIELLADGGLDEDTVDDLLPDGAHTPDAEYVVADGAGVDPGVEEAVLTLQNPPNQYVEIAKELEPKFESFKAGGVNSNLNGQTNIDLSSRIVVFDMSSFSDTGEMPLIMHAMLNWAYVEARQSDHRTDVTFEEAHYLLGRQGARNLINLFIRHARHFNAGLTLISQTAEEFLKNDAVREIYDNCDIKQLFYQENIDPSVVDYFDLSEDEVRFIQRAARGEESPYSECLLSTTQHGRRRLELYSGDFEHHVLEDDLDPWLWLKERDRLNERDRAWLENQDRLETDRTPDDRGTSASPSNGRIQTPERSKTEFEFVDDSDLASGERDLGDNADTGD